MRPLRFAFSWRFRAVLLHRICFFAIMRAITTSEREKGMDIKQFYAIPGERPLDNWKPDGGFTGIFRTIAFVGDSLSSGEFESAKEDGTSAYHDMYEYSWGQYIARAAGLTAYNFSKGGMMAKTYMESFAEERGFWDESLKAQAYVMALGANDRNHIELGDIDDVDTTDWHNNKPTFIGYYAQILQRYREMQPRARFFLVTMPRSVPESEEQVAKKEKHAQLLHALAEKFPNTYVIDLFHEGPVHDEEFQHNFYLRGHLNPAGYLFTAQMMMTYIDYIIRNNPRDFSEVPFIGTDLHG